MSTPGRGFLLNRHALRQTYSVSAWPLLSGKAVIREAEALKETGDAYKYSIPWAQVAVLQNKCMVSPETVITVSLTYSLIVL